MGPFFGKLVVSEIRNYHPVHNHLACADLHGPLDDVDRSKELTVEDGCTPYFTLQI